MLNIFLKTSAPLGNFYLYGSIQFLIFSGSSPSNICFFPPALSLTLDNRGDTLAKSLENSPRPWNLIRLLHSISNWASSPEYLVSVLNVIFRLDFVSSCDDSVIVLTFQQGKKVNQRELCHSISFSNSFWHNPCFYDPLLFHTVVVL